MAPDWVCSKHPLASPPLKSSDPYPKVPPLTGVFRQMGMAGAQSCDTCAPTRAQKKRATAVLRIILTIKNCGFVIYKSNPALYSTTIYVVKACIADVKSFINVYLCSLDKTAMKVEQALEEQYEDRGNDHVGSSSETPIRKDAFELSDEEKVERIQRNVREIMETLGLDLDDDSLNGTPKRVAKMYVKELFGGLHPKRKPESSTFDNKYKYGEMLVEKNIVLYSTCEHHLLPIVGRAHIAHISSGTAVPITSMNR